MKPTAQEHVLGRTHVPPFWQSGEQTAENEGSNKISSQKSQYILFGQRLEDAPIWRRKLSRWPFLSIAATTSMYNDNSKMTYIQLQLQVTDLYGRLIDQFQKIS